jgi:hypothetical protein
MPADALATHLQNFYIVCGTAIPVLFVALAVQTPKDSPAPGLKWIAGVGLWIAGVGLMFAGEVASVLGLLSDSTSSVWKALAFFGTTYGASFVVLVNLLQRWKRPDA